VRYFFPAFLHIFHKNPHSSMIKSVGDFISTQKNSLSTLCVILEGLAHVFICKMLFVRRINACRVYDNSIKRLISSFVCRPKSSGPRPKFLLHPWLVSEEKELTFVRKVSEVLLLHILPKEYAMCKTSRELLREILMLILCTIVIFALIDQQLHACLGKSIKCVFLDNW
jgi:hypothetical protein